MTDKKTILILTDYYTPGFKAGGPIRSIEGFVHAFAEDYNIKIITTDRDINDKKPYENITPNNWQEKGPAKIFYLKKNYAEYYNLLRTIQKCSYDLVYINSFFSVKMSIFPIVFRALNLIPRTSLIIAPRGEFSPEAIKIRMLRKSFYIKIFENLKTKNDIFWQASTIYEKIDIIKVMKSLDKNRVFIAGNLSKATNKISNTERLEYLNDQNQKLRLVFLSRISVKKNLDFALRVLSGIDLDVEFDVYGPIEDQPYWGKCLKIIEKMPKNVNVKYCGTVSPENVVSKLMQYDLFFFPTRGENYGHVIEEAIHAGLPILISDQTPWKDLEQKGIGCEKELSNMEDFIKYIKYFKDLSPEKRAKLKTNVSNHSKKIGNKKDIIYSNKLMIMSALGE